MLWNVNVCKWWTPLEGRGRGKAATCVWLHGRLITISVCACVWCQKGRHQRQQQTNTHTTHSCFRVISQGHAADSRMLLGESASDRQEAAETSDMMRNRFQRSGEKVKLLPCDVDRNLSSGDLGGCILNLYFCFFSCFNATTLRSNNKKAENTLKG